MGSAAGDPNSPAGQGGGIYNSGTMTITTSTVSGGYTEASGGGIDNDGTLLASGSQDNTIKLWDPKDGKLLPEVIELIDFIAQHHQLVLETGHVSAEEVLMVVHEAHKRGVTHIVVTHGIRRATAAARIS